MSTDLYGVRILEVLPEAKKVRFQLIVTYYETAYRSHMPLLSDITGIFRVVADSSNSGYRKSPIADELTVDQYCNEKWVNENAYKFIAEFQLLSKLNHPLRSYKGLSDFYYYREGRWKDEEKLVQGTYEVTMTDAKYLAHLQVGQAWGTTAYDTHGFRYYKDGESPNLPDLLGAKVFKPEAYMLEGFDRAFVNSMRAGLDGSFCYFVFAQNSETSRVDELLKINWADGALLERSAVLDMRAISADGLEHDGLTFWFNFSNIVKIWEGVPPKFKHKVYVAASGLWSAELKAKRFTFFDQKNKKTWQIDCEKPLRGGAISPDDKYLVLCDDSATLVVWDLEARAEAYRLEMPAGDSRPSQLAFSPDGRYLAMVSYDKFLRIVDLERRVWVYHYRPMQRGEHPSEFAWGPTGFVMQTAIYSRSIEFNILVAVR